MPLSVSLDKAAKILARQVYGAVNADTEGMAMDALEIAMQEIASETHLIGQEAEKTISTTGANSYTISTAIDADVLRIVKAKTKWGAIDVMRKAEFMVRYPDFETYRSGIPRFLVLWGDDSMYLWPDQTGDSLLVIYYKLIETTMAGQILSKLLDIARKFADPDKDTRMVNRLVAKEALDAVKKSQTRASDLPIRFLPEQRVNTINHYKRSRR